MIEDERNYHIKDRMDYVLKSIKTIGVQIETPVIGAYCILSKKVGKQTAINVHVIAEVGNYDANTTLFELDVIKIEVKD